MYDTIIWATDGSDGANLALAEARGLATLTGGRIVAVHCDQRLTGRAMEWPALADEEDLLAKIRGQVDELLADGIDVRFVMRESHREPADVVAEIAAESNADVIVCGTRGAGRFSGAFLGSFALRLLHVAPCPVLAVRETAQAARRAEPVEAEVGA